MINMITIKPNQLKPGDKINGHEYGWLTLTKFQKTWNGIECTFYNASRGNITKFFDPVFDKDKFIDVIREV